MNLLYNGFAVHEIGEFTISSSREYEEGQRAKVTLKVAVTLFERTYADNYALVTSLKAALLTREAVLQWTDTDTQEDYVNQTVTLQSDDLPDEWGTYQMSFNLVFVYYEQNLTTNNLPLVYSPGSSPVTLGNVSKFSETVTSERFSPYHSHRSMVKGKIAVSGFLLTDTTASLDDRRTDLIALEQALKTALASKEGTLQFGPSGSVFNQTVRVEEFTAEIDQLHYAVNWSFSASYTLFPDESNFATVEYQADQKDQNTGEQFLSITGKIVSGTEAAARTKLAALIPTVLAQYGYNTASQQQRNDSTAHQVSANADGDFFTELSFTLEYRRWRSDNQTATFQKTGGSTPIPFGNVRTWDYHYTARRFNDQRSQRQRAGGSISATGTWLGDPTLSLSARRTALLAAQAAMVNEVNNADGTLVYGPFSQVVRIEDLRAEINQAMTGIDWSFTATWSLFPSESGYATVDFTVAQNSNAEDGEETLSFAGTILAPDEALARTKLGTLRTTMLTTYGYNINQQLRPQSTVRSVYANGDATQTLAGHEASDGTTFIELTFSEEYRRRRSSLVSWTMGTNSRSDISTGLMLTTFSGTVVASGSSVSAAYATALAKAAVLGAGMESTVGGNAFMRNSQINWDQRQIQSGNVVEFVRLSFNYEYQSKLATGQAYLEVNTDTNVETFGTDSITVSGYVIATDAATAATLYGSQVRTAFNTSLIQGERKTQSKVLAQNSGGFTQQDIRLDFSFNVFSPKASGTVNYRYGISVSNDYLTLLSTTRIRGSVYALNAAAAATALAALMTGLGLGTVLREEHSTDSEYTSASAITGFIKYDFEQEFQNRITGISGVLEMKVTEAVKFSGVRWVVQPIPRASDGTGGVSIPQDAGLQEGSRTIRGSVTAATTAAAVSWARQQRALLTGDDNGNNYPQPEELEIEYVFVPRVDGVAIGSSANVQLYRINFGFSEILPYYPPA
jgi:hypothetical protein